MGSVERGTRISNNAFPGRMRDRLSWDSADQSLTRLLDLGIASVIFLAPLFMGGRHPVGRLAYVGLICLVATIWAARQVIRPHARWRWSGIEWLIIAGLGLLLLQLVQLPQAWLTAISPKLPEYLPIWFRGDSSVNLGTWSQLSLYPQATRSALVMFLAYSGFFLVLVQRIQTLEDVERLFRWIALATVGMAALGILQMLLSNGKFLWLYQHPSRDTNGIVKGTFACQNHLAHLMAIGVVPLIWWAQHVQNGKARARDRSLTLLLIGIGVVTLACFLAFSRGGVLVILLAAVSCVLGYYALSLLGRKCLFAVVGLALLLAVALFIFGIEQLAAEMDSVSRLSVEEMDAGGIRRELWLADWKSFRDFSAFGTGVGSHPEVYPIHFTRNLLVELSYAESGYVQLLMETGVAGVTLLATGMAFVLYWCTKVFRVTKDRRIRSVLFAIAAVLLASLVHSIWDFVWYIPACLVATLVFLACLCRLRHFAIESAGTPAAVSELDASPRRRVSAGLRWTAGMVIIAAVSQQMISFQLPAALGSSQWDAYEIAVHAAKGENDPSKVQDTVLSALPALQTAATRDSNNARVQLKLAAMYVLQFDVAQQAATNPMSLDQIRDVVRTSKFANLAEQNRWLERAVGENCKYLRLAYHHAWRAARLSPFQGEAYIHLNRLGFLYECPQTASNAWMQQALLVRPHHGLVLIDAGVDAARSGELAGSIEYFRRAFGKGAECQQRVIELLAAALPAALLLDEFQPDVEGLGRLIDFYHGSGRAEDLRELLPRYVELLEKDDGAKSGSDQATAWFRGYTAHKLIGDDKSALRCVRRAVKAAPRHASANLAFARELIKAGQSDEAVEHLRGCLYRRPHDAQLKQLLVLARKQQLEGDLQDRDRARR